jgi:hypothetical protein
LSHVAADHPGITCGADRMLTEQLVLAGFGKPRLGRQHLCRPWFLIWSPSMLLLDM